MQVVELLVVDFDGFDPFAEPLGGTGCLGYDGWIEIRIGKEVGADSRHDVRWDRILFIFYRIGLNCMSMNMNMSS